MEKLFRSIILLDKPSGPTSLECAEKVRKIFSAKKSGHAGTLDPAVTGVLIIALDEATKAMPVLICLEKTYEGVMHIHKDFDEKILRGTVKLFTGKIIQKPPVKSAVSRIPRERDIYSFEITKIQGRDAHFQVRCQAGTYIRKLCSDFGEKMGTGAHMKSLRRIKAGQFSVKDCVSLESLEKNPEKHLVSLETAFQRIGIKRIFVKEDSVRKILNGSPVLSSHIEKKDSGIQAGERIGIFSGQKLVALGVAKAKDSVARTERIFF
ncbi:MAG: RNA-guided pseudouridylation complex pseudouridine synthase subunit Cbf5 [Candidatus Aenigmarchaeota archaeon]|nr:RNA-guided pseudouridylation complex pseudouridine synthase subunit Cbf5 [Candidatus Aenigmarchaeota archaeon]